MKPGATKEQIIRMTGELIVRNGIRALRVDEIVQTLGISKRTLYEMFLDKTNLITICLRELNEQQKERMEECVGRETDHSLMRLFRLLNEYIDSMYRVGSDFLTDIRSREEYATIYNDSKKHWQELITAQLENCSAEGYLDQRVDLPLLASRLMSSLFRSRTEGFPHSEQYVFSRLLIRGCALPKGIEWIDHTPLDTDGKR